MSDTDCEWCSANQNCNDITTTDMDKVSVDIVGTVDASDWLQTDAWWLIYNAVIKKYQLVQASKTRYDMTFMH